MSVGAGPEFSSRGEVSPITPIYNDKCFKGRESKEFISSRKPSYSHFKSNSKL